MILHGGLVARLVRGRWLGVLITGPSGSGKSDLALRMLDHGFVLVSDDRTVLWASGGKLFGQAPEPLAGLMEVRGLDIARLPHRRFAQAALVAECGAAGIERLPEPASVPLLGCPIPLVRLAATEASAPAKLRHALLALG